MQKTEKAIDIKIGTIKSNILRVEILINTRVSIKNIKVTNKARPLLI
jgi:hypothetical protein